MTRATIDYGIDLGTTNSSIAVLRGTAIEVIKNNEGQEYTPSAVWVDKKGALYIGDLAKQQLAKDSSNVYFEFKLQMGKRQEYRFPNTGRAMLPEELSAEILKSLKADVLQRNGENI